MKRLLIALLLTSIGMLCQAQSTTKIKPYGFVRTYLNVDSRKTYTVLGGEYNMLPFDHAWNADSTCDLNATSHTQIQALTSRIGLLVEGPSVGNMASTACVETDFGGFGTNNTVLRLRLAYVKLASVNDRSAYEIVVGQDWHPMCGSVMPDVLGMAAGAPFRPHSRTPQVRLDWHQRRFSLTAALLSQLQFTSVGPTSASDPTPHASTDFAYHAMLPEAFVGAAWNSKGITCQVGLDALMLRPRTHALIGGTEQRVDERLVSFSPTVYVQGQRDLLSIKARATLSANTTHLNQLVGYAVVDVDPDGSWRYAPMRSLVEFIDIAYGRRCRANLFLGYMKNLGTSASLHDFGSSYLIYMKGSEQFTHLNSAWRIAPSISWTVSAMTVGIEYEATGATFGDIASNGAIANNDHLHQVVDHRLCAMVKYIF